MRFRILPNRFFPPDGGDGKDSLAFMLSPSSGAHHAGTEGFFETRHFTRLSVFI
jgi:hypothetical protein